MKIMLKIELLRAFKSKGMLAAVMIGCAISLWGTITAAIPMSEHMNIMVNGVLMRPNSVFNVWLGISNGNTALQQSVYFMIFPMIAVLPFADSYFADKKAGYIKNIFIRTQKKHYYIAKYSAVFLSGGVAVTVPLMFDLFTNSMILPALKPDALYGMYSLTEHVVLARVMASTPYLYCFVIILNIFVFSGLFACISLAVTGIFENRFLILITPFLVSVILKYLFEWMGVYTYAPDFFLRGGIEYTSVLEMLILAGILLFGSVSVFMVRGMKNETY